MQSSIPSWRHPPPSLISHRSPFFLTTTIHSYNQTNKFNLLLLLLSPNSSKLTPSNAFSHSTHNQKTFYPKQKHASNFIHNKAEQRHGKLHVQELVNRIKSLEDTKKLEIINQNRCQTISDFNYMLMALVAANEHEIALKLSSDLSSYELDLDSWTYSIIIRCYCQKDDPIEAKKVLDLMIQTGFQPNVATFTEIINSFCKRGRLQKAYEIFEVMGRVGCEPTINTYNCLLKGLCYVGRVEEAYHLLLKIKKSSKKPDIYTYTVVMDGFCKVGRSNEAMELLQEALQMGLTPNAVTFNTLFNGYFKEGKPLEGIDLLKQMKGKDPNCMPDYISYSTLLHGLLKWGETRSALMIYKEMVGIGFEVDERLVNTLLRQLCRRSRKEKDLLKDAYQVFDKMTNSVCVIYPATHELVVEAFCLGKEMDNAVMNLGEMIRLGYSPKSFTFDNVIRVLCGEGKLEEAMWVLVVLYGGNRIPNRMGFNVLINKLNRQGMKMAACVVYGAALKRGIVPMNKPRD